MYARVSVLAILDNTTHDTLNSTRMRTRCVTVGLTALSARLSLKYRSVLTNLNLGSQKKHHYCKNEEEVTCKTRQKFQVEDGILALLYLIMYSIIKITHKRTA